MFELYDIYCDLNESLDHMLKNGTHYDIDSKMREVEMPMSEGMKSVSNEFQMASDLVINTPELEKYKDEVLSQFEELKKATPKGLEKIYKKVYKTLGKLSKEAK